MFHALCRNVSLKSDYPRVADDAEPIPVLTSRGLAMRECVGSPFDIQRNGLVEEFLRVLLPRLCLSQGSRVGRLRQETQEVNKKRSEEKKIRARMLKRCEKARSGEYHEL